MIIDDVNNVQFIFISKFNFLIVKLIFSYNHISHCANHYCVIFFLLTSREHDKFSISSLHPIVNLIKFLIIEKCDFLFLLF